jgi:hypothetical protein
MDEQYTHSQTNKYFPQNYYCKKEEAFDLYKLNNISSLGTSNTSKKS